jgi:hypothetical protein
MKTGRLALHRTPRQTRLLHRLIQEQGVDDGAYALCFTNRDGLALPNSKPGDDVEATSGYVLDRAGRVFFFQLGWSTAAQAPALTAWEQVPPEPDWADDPEYRHARERVGLPVRA